MAAALLAAAAGAASAEETASPDRYRLVLTGGAVHDVRGPVERRDGLVLFRDEGGRLASLPEGQVREVLPLPRVEPRPVVRPGPPRPAAAPAAPGPAGRFTNADLPASDEPAPDPAADAEPAAPDEIPEVAPEPEPAAVAPAAEPQPEPEPSILAPPPTEVAGRPEGWWREEIARRRAAIRDLERQENVTYRLWICAMEDIPLTGGECKPLNRLPPVNKLPRTPTQRSLTAQLERIRTQLEQQRGGLASFIDEAIAAGVPTPWLLDEP